MNDLTLPITKKLLFDNIDGCLGVADRVFRKAGVPPNLARKYLKEHKLEEEFNQALLNDLDVVVEEMEKKLIEKGIKAWDVPAIKKFLESKAIHLGYGEKIETESNIPLTIQIVKNYEDKKEIVDITPKSEQIEGPSSDG